MVLLGLLPLLLGGYVRGNDVGRPGPDGAGGVLLLVLGFRPFVVDGFSSYASCCMGGNVLGEGVGRTCTGGSAGFCVSSYGRWMIVPS